MVWKLFSKELHDAIRERGFDKPTSIQSQGIPPIIKGENTLLIAPTGVGKTESVLFPVFDEFVKDRKKSELSPISILYITPLKSLNRDLLKRIMWWSKKLDFDVSVRHGDTSQYERSMQAANPADMFITTPETLQAMLVGSKMREHLRNVRWIVIDEVHELVSSKRGVQLSVGLERLKNLIHPHKKHKIQIVGLSATVGSPENVAEFITAGEKCRIINAEERKKVDIKVESPRPVSNDKNVSENIFVPTETVARLRRINDLIKKNDSVLTFTNTRQFAEVLSSRLKAMDKELSVETHHSSLSKQVRIEAEDNFKKQKLKSLVCTSSLELGIDIGSINLVLQYMSPRQVSKLLQRVGRAGHKITMESNGTIISTDSEDCFESTIIAKLGKERKIEKTDIYGKSLDVLGHQIVGLSLEEYNIPLDKAYKIIKKAIPFKDLTKDEFINVARLMQKLGFLWVGSKFDDYVPLRRRKNSWIYYYQNLSTIPDVKNYRIIDIVTNKPVGTLDAEFIALHGVPGTSFIVKGQSWKIIDIGERDIKVEPESNIQAAIPAWEGELIPVPFDVAQGVGKLRKEIGDMIISNIPQKAIIRKITEDYPVTSDVALKMYNTIERQVQFGVVPDHQKILAEYREDHVILHTHFGSLVNETIGRVLAMLLTNKIGSVGLQTDPYRIMIKVPGYQYKEVVNTFIGIGPGEIQGLLEISLPNEEIFTWRFIHVSQRLGMIARHADYGKAYFRKIIDVYFKQPPYLEALHEIFQEKLDVSKSKEVLGMIDSGKIKIKTMPGLSPLGEAGLSRKFEIVAPEKPESEIFGLFRKRLMSTKMGLVCMNCGEIFSSYSIENVPDEIKCRHCAAKLIGYAPQKYVREASRMVRKTIRGEELEKEEKKHYMMMMDSASMILHHGKDAILALAGRGVGPKTAARILRKNVKEDDLLRAILDEEKRFARTKRFWK
ncbi:MAG: DEAD/DEAH box helicase [Candidatus Aenigmarchaeota archaeon]|nr:DEAD/DEAH box helicase [Candidatus Aenigmarchaeota archaeon]